MPSVISSITLQNFSENANRQAYGAGMDIYDFNSPKSGVGALKTVRNSIILRQDAARAYFHQFATPCK